MVARQQTIQHSVHWRSRITIGWMERAQQEGHAVSDHHNQTTRLASVCATVQLTFPISLHQSLPPHSLNPFRVAQTAHLTAR